MKPTEGMKMEWISVKDRKPKCFATTVNVKIKNGEECKAHFYSDGMSWISFYGQKSTAWWEYKTGNPLYDITHWMPLETSKE